MKSLILISISILLCANSYSQGICGNYIGQEYGSRTYQHNKKGKTVNETVEYTDKYLNLKADSTFSFEYFQDCGFCNSQGGNTKSCTGTWTFAKDTVYLTSKYTQADFTEVKEAYFPTKENQLLKIVNVSVPYENDDSLDLTAQLKKISADTSVDWFRGRMGIRLHFSKTSDSYFYNKVLCKENDTVYFKGKTPSTINVSSMEGYAAIECYYTPKDTTANYFEIKLKRTVKGENMWLKKYKLAFVNNELRPPDLNDGNLSVDGKRYYHKQKEPKKK